jgi:hypothetical protein
MTVLLTLPGLAPVRRVLAGWRCPACVEGRSLPTWIPRWLGEFHTDNGPDASLCLHVDNASAWARTVTIESDSPQVVPDTTVLEIAPHARGRCDLTLSPTGPSGDRAVVEALIRISGAHEHQLRWVAAAGKARPRRTGVTAVDAPVLVHTWSDHFSAFRPDGTH